MDKFLKMVFDGNIRNQLQMLSQVQNTLGGLQSTLQAYEDNTEFKMPLTEIEEAINKIKLAGTKLREVLMEK